MDRSRDPLDRPEAHPSEEPEPSTSSNMTLPGQEASKDATLASSPNHLQDSEIAIIGMAGVFPQAEDVEEFWRNLRDGVDCITVVPRERWNLEDFYDEQVSIRGKTYSKWGGFVEGIDRFDATFFNIPPHEAARMDPQQRMFLETAWRTLEHAGYGGEALYGSRTGVFVGVCGSHYESISKDRNDQLLSGLSNQSAIVANRVSYLMNLRGPSIALNTLCSSSLTALNLACQSILFGESDYAIAGGVFLVMPEDYYIMLSQMRVLSRAGRCMTFDKDADGYVPGEGVGAVLLKRLSDAIRDRDNILAVIKGWAVNHGGRASHLAAPNYEAHADVIQRALEMAGIHPEAIDYVEAHGTGTALGDPVEIQGLTSAFRKYTDRKQFCAIGSAKTNIGHLEPAAGIAGLIKVILCMQHKQIPPSLHFHRENPFLRLRETPFYVNEILSDWPARNGPRRAGLSSFGLGGSNAHVILEETTRPLELEAEREERPQHLFVLSAKTRTALSRLVNRFKDHLQDDRGQRLTDICFTACMGRGHFNHRLAIVGEGRDQLTDELERISSKGVEDDPSSRGRVFYGKTKTASWLVGNPPHFAGVFLKSLRKERSVEGNGQSKHAIESVARGKNKPRIVFLFSEEGLPDPIEMAEMDQLLTLPAMKGAIGQCEQIVSGRLGHSLLKSIRRRYGTKRRSENESLRLAVNFSWEYGIARVWMSWGMAPEAVWGTGLGAYVAKCVSGLLSLEEAFGEMWGEGSRAKQCCQAEVLIVSEQRMELVDTGEMERPIWEELKENRQGRLHDLVRTVKARGYGVFLGIGRGDGLWQDLREAIGHGGDEIFLPSGSQKGVGLYGSLLGSLGELYTKGVDINWDGVYQGAKCRRVPLPTYPFERKRFWVTRKDTIAMADWAVSGKQEKEIKHPFLGRRVGEDTWELELGVDRGALIDDHRIRGKRILSGATLLEMGLMAGKARGHGRVVGSLEEVTFVEPLEVKETEKVCVRILVEEEPGRETKSWKVISLQDERKTRKDHVLGRIGYREREEEAERYPIEAIKERCQREVPGQDVYRYFRKVGLEYGRWYRSVDCLWIGHDEVLGLLILPDGAAKDVTPYDLHPSMLDGAFQSTIGLLQGLGGEHGLASYVPFYIRSLRILGRLDSSCYAHVRHAARKEGVGKSLQVDISLLAMDGRELVRVAGLVVRRIGEDSVREKRRGEGEPLRYPEWFYQVVWRRKDMGTDLRPFADGGSWLVFSKRGGSGEGLCSCLEREKQEVFRVYPRAGNAELDTKPFSIDPGSSNHYQQLVQAWKRGGKPLKGVVHLWGVDGVGQGDPHREEQACFYSLFYLYKIISAENLSLPSGIWLVTRNSQPFGSGPYQPEQALAWGLVRAARKEERRINSCCIDLERQEETETVVGAELMRGSVEPEVVYRDELRYVPQIERLGAEVFREGEKEDGWRFRGVYLITGGTGGIGLELGKYLCRSMRARLVLVGRRRIMTDEASRAVEEMKALGGEVVYFPADVGNLDQMREVIVEVRKKYGRLDGVVHGAGILRDGLLRTKSEESIRQVLWPKVQGLRVLREVTKTEDLSVFVLFSSISGVLGNIGQGDYGAANAFMDSYGLELARSGERVRVVDWSLWGRVGMGSGMEDRSIASGVRAMAPEDGLEALGWALRIKADRLLIGDVEAERVFGLGKESEESEGAPETREISDMPQERLERRIADLFIQELVEKLGYERDDLDEGMGFEELGFDSVFAVEVVRMYEERAGISLDPTILFDYSTIRDLSRYLAQEYGRQFARAFLAEGDEVPEGKDHMEGEVDVTKEAMEIPTQGGMSQELLERRIGDLFIQELVEKLGYERDDLDEGMGFEELGFDSVFAVEVVRMYEERAGISLDPTILFDYSTIRDLSRYLAQEYGRQFVRAFSAESAEEKDQTEEPIVGRVELADVGLSEAQKADEQRAEDIAVIGIAGRFPGAGNLEGFWNNLRQGVDAITEMPPERFDSQQPILEEGRPREKIWGGFLDGIDEFDAKFFNLSGHLAEAMDPQHRLFLETSYEALENAGYVGRKIRGTKTGVFVGISAMDYYHYAISEARVLNPHLSIGNAFSIAANRVSHFFDLKGPSLAIDTACSSSLVALHMACQSIRSGESAMAIAGGVNITLSPVDFILFQKAGMLSERGRCMSFDDEADGYVRGEGVGVVVLKPHREATHDGDTIHAVLKGSAVFHDGRTAGLTVPNAKAQTEVLLSAWRESRIDPESLSYIEAHGTGTPLGDPIEVRGLNQAFREYTNQRGFCALGSVKTNIGHLESAAGIAGVLKVLLCLKHRELVPTLHYKKANRRIRFENSPLYINGGLHAWIQRDGPRRAGVSSFGFGGTNAHVVLEEAEPIAHTEGLWERPVEWVVLSAKSERTLRQRVRDLRDWLRREKGDFTLEDISFTLAVGRDHFQYRLAIPVRSLNELEEKITGRDSAGHGRVGRIYGRNPARRDPGVAFVFAGEEFDDGSRGEKLYRKEKIFREAVDHCAELLDPQMERPFLSLLYAADGYRVEFDQIEAAEPLLFALGYSLAQLWMSWGVKPAVVSGYGVGEYVSACVAGMLGLEDAARLTVERTRWRRKMAEVGHGASVATFEDTLNTISFSIPRIPLLASVAEELVVDRILGVDYWMRQLRESIPTSPLIERLQAHGYGVFLKAGSADNSSGIDEGTEHQEKAPLIVSSLKPDTDDQESILEALAGLYVRGVNIDWEAYYRGSGRRRIPLPTYPFERKRCWITPVEPPQEGRNRSLSKQEHNPKEKP